MYIHIPTKYKDLNLSDGEATIASFLLMLCDEHGWDNYYLINPYDFKKMLGQNHWMTEFDSKGLDKLKEHMHIVQLDEHNWALKFKYDKIKEMKMIRSNSTQMPHTCRHEIKSERSMMLWCYIMGKWNSDKGVLGNSTDILPYKSSTRMLDRMEYRNFQTDYHK